MATQTEKLAAKKAKAKPATTKAKTTKATVKKAPRKATTKAKASTKRKTTSAQKAKVAEAKASNKDKAREMFEAGQTRREIADALGISYATAYAHTADMKDAAGAQVGRARIFVEVDGEQVPRTTAMREDYEDGESIGDIARKYGVIYQVAYQAVKPLIEREDDEE